MTRWMLRCLLPAAAAVAGACQQVPDSALTIRTDALPDARVRMDYEVTLEAADGVGELRWLLDDGELPAGLELDPAGVIAGAPEESGIFPLLIAAEDDAGDDVVDVVLEVPPVALISGFEPFGGYATNPSYDALLELHEQRVAGFDVRAVELPVEWDVSWELLLDEIDWLAPAVVLGSGMADTDAMRYEVRAQNREDYTDNAGVTRFGDEVVDGGPDALETALPAEMLADAVEEAGYDALVSTNAGTYLCNDIFYHLTHYEQYEADDPPLTGFVHVPPAPYSGSFEVADITEAHRIELDALARWMAGERERRAAAADTDAAPTYLRSLPR